MPRQKTLPARRSEAERAAASWTDRDLEVASGAGPASLPAPAVGDIATDRPASVEVVFSDNEEEREVEEEVITVSDDDHDQDDDLEVLSDSRISAKTAAGKVTGKKKKKCPRSIALTPAQEEYARVSAELAEFDFYVTVSERLERFADDPVVGTLPLTLLDRPSELPRAKKFWVYVSESLERAVLYFEWGSRPEGTSGRPRVEQTQLLEVAAATLPFETWRLLFGAGGGVEAVLRDYTSFTGELYVDVLVREKLFVPLRHPSEVPRRVNTSCRALLRRLLNIPGKEYEFLPLGAVDVEALYRRLAARRGLGDDPEGGENSEPTPDPQHEQLLPKLRPYQRAAVTWMLRRERRPPADPSKLHPLYVPITLGGETVYYCHLGGFAVRERPGAVTSPPGGILADEMGLGKDGGDPFPRAKPCPF